MTLTQRSDHDRSGYLLQILQPLQLLKFPKMFKLSKMFNVSKMFMILNMSWILWKVRLRQRQNPM